MFFTVFRYIRVAIIGIGTDIIKVSRLKKSLDKYGSKFARRILHENEFQIFDQRNQLAESSSMKQNTSLHYLAKRFAAKEALSKALGTGIAKGISFNEIEVRNNEEGKPELILHGVAADIASNLGVERLFISLSDEAKYAIAYVTLEGK